MTGVRSLGHVGIYVRDLEASRRFYTEMLGLQVTDEDLTRGVVFLSAQPEEEHHELALFRGREAPPGQGTVQQISFRVDSLADLKAIYRRLKQAGVRFDRVVSHGIALGAYFYDPDDNRVEAYWRTGFLAPQPYSQPVDLEAPDEELVAIARSAPQRA